MKIVVLGVGHMGAWLANELKVNNDVYVYDIDLTKTKRLDGVSVISKLDDIEVVKPQMLINTVSISETVSVFKSVAQFITIECMIIDMASVKGDIPAYYQTCGFKFASVHPMFGPTFANIQDLKEENAIVISESDTDAKDFLRIFFEEKGINVFEFSFEEHDKMIAYSLTLPFASSMVFAACMDNTAVPGTTFKKHLSIAQGLLSEDDYLLADIMFNRYSVKELDKVTSRLEFLKHIIKGKDYEEAVKFFNSLRNNIKK